MVFPAWAEKNPKMKTENYRAVGRAHTTEICEYPKIKETLTPSDVPGLPGPLGAKAGNV